MRPSFSFSRSRSVVAGRPILSALTFGAGAGVLLLAWQSACSSSGSTPPGGSAACTALATCCAEMSGANASTCLALVSGPATLCATELTSFVQEGRCNGTTPLPDAGTTPCTVTGTCIDAGHATGNDASGGTTSCTTTGQCPNQATYQTCVTGSGSSCSAIVTFAPGTGGGAFPCASCSDCSSAVALAASSCGSVTPPVDGGSIHDAGHDVDNCGTAPTLHPEVEAGVYCPFTPTGSTRCMGGQECCESPANLTNMSSCQANGTTCPVAGSIPWACNGPLDCASSSLGATCCGVGAVMEDTTCSFYRGSAFTGSHCATGCSAGEVILCDQAVQCTAGTCTPFKVDGIAFGTCM